MHWLFAGRSRSPRGGGSPPIARQLAMAVIPSSVRRRLELLPRGDDDGGGAASSSGGGSDEGAPARAGRGPSSPRHAGLLSGMLSSLSLA